MISIFRFFILAYALIGGASLSMAQSNEDGVAVIIGNKIYSGRIPEVSYAHRDADAMRHYILNVLGYAEENVIDLRDATKSQLESAFGNSNSHKGQIWQYIDPAGGSDVTVYYSGHGVPGNDKRGYLLPSDANPDTAEINGYPIDLLYANLGKLKTKSVTVLLDACFSGDSGGGMLIRSASPVFMQSDIPDTSSDNMTVITAASGTQLASWDDNAQHGLFTHHLLDALYGGADDNTDGQITALEVKAYLDKKMTRAARRNHRREQDASLNGEVAAVLAFASNGNYASRPSFGRDSGSVLEDNTVTPSAIEVTDLQEVRYALKNTNIRSYPSTQGTKVGKFLQGDAVEVTGKAGNWYRVALLNGKVGYVYGELLGEKSVFLDNNLAGNSNNDNNQDVADGVEIYQDCDVCPDMVHIPAGDFSMGSHNGDADELPVHNVNFDYGFYVSQNEITRGQFAEFVKDTGFNTGDSCHVYRDGKWLEEEGVNWRNPGFSQSDQHPVVCVSWEEATAYTQWLQTKTDKNYRLLSESEWEYAAKAGGDFDYLITPSPALACTVANAAASETSYDDRNEECRDGYEFTAPVNFGNQNKWGLHAVHGNVWEWVADCDTSDYNSSPVDGSADLNGNCDERRLRGGGFTSSFKTISLANRGSIEPDRRDFDTGFRVAVSFNDSDDAAAASSSEDEGDWDYNQIYQECDECPDIKIVPAGSFRLGAIDGDAEADDDESPAFDVEISEPFAIGLYEVTYDQFAMFIDATDHYIEDGCMVFDDEWTFKSGLSWRNPGYAVRGNHAVTCVGYDDAVAYTEWLSKLTGEIYRLPTETQFAYAARAGAKGLYHHGDDKSDLCYHMNFAEISSTGISDAYDGCNDGYSAMAPIGQFSANEFGLYDTLGNAWEWTLDCHEADLNNVPTTGDPNYAGECENRVIRGGSWTSTPTGVRLSNRAGIDSRDNDVGFRVVRVLN